MASRSCAWFYVAIPACLGLIRRMRLSVPMLLLVLLASCSTSRPHQTVTLENQSVTTDPIDQLVARLSASHGMWNMGLSSGVNMPKTATPEEVIKRRIPEGAHYKILSMRQIHIPGTVGAETYTAALIQADSGQKIVIAGYIQAVGWWTRVYDAKL